MGEEERLQKIIAAAGLASRRHAEELIQQGRVTVNGRIVTRLGAKADPQRDHIKVDGKLIHGLPQKLYFLLNKPRQVISSVSDPEGRVKVTDLIDTSRRIYPVGRLDYNTEGVILLTNDGDFAKIVTTAGRHMPKVYHVKVRSTPEEQELIRLRKGLRLKTGVRLAPCRIVPIREKETNWFEVTLTQGKNRQIREMFESIGHPVQKLRRVRIGFLTSDGLAVGQYRRLTPLEVERILRIGRRMGKQ
ncbi:MAG: rRNA pseudouridine synthase [Acidobacteria bacterium]|mgnify:CR=1 FL=1|nr:rRNA pseudouridine synthase [Acidobacteriota bacterium]